MIGLLEKDVGSDSRFMEFSVVLHGGCRDIYIDTADVAVFMMNAVNGVDAFKNVFNRVVYGILAGFNRKTLVA